MGNKPHLTGRQKKKKKVESAEMMSWIRFSRSTPRDENLCANDFFLECYQEKLVKEWQGQERKPRERVISENV